MNNLRSSVEAIGDFPPSMTDKPTVTDGLSDTSMPSNIITFVNTGKMSKQDMYDYISQQVVPQFKHIQGAGGIWAHTAAVKKAVRVWLQPDRMMALNMSASDVVGHIGVHTTRHLLRVLSKGQVTSRSTQ